MAVTAHVFPSADLKAVTKTWNLGSGGDTLKVALVASGTFNWVAATQAYVTVSDFLGNAGSGGGGALTEVSTSGTGYTRQTLTSQTTTNSALVTTLTCANPSWASATFSAVYAVFYDAVVDTNDTTRNLICYWDLGGTDTVSAGTFTLNIAGTGLVTWTAS